VIASSSGCRHWAVNLGRFEYSLPLLGWHDEEPVTIHTPSRLPGKRFAEWQSGRAYIYLGLIHGGRVLECRFLGWCLR
jgi:hypothetical protein